MTVQENREANERIAELRDKVNALHRAVEELKETGICEDILLIAIQRSARRHYSGGGLIGVKEIKWILAGLEGLDEYLFPEKGGD